ncbi:DNA topology modulation protein [Streptococcus oricebi]|uniref:Topology modulation protein n=1 Tax=Streptococcus oricebi TaxID=1547447 RepID=A0ABS5B3M5_9STRE|nr:DNA topology modulation protein [Streptococcus oricebi]MBP2623111.1 topology modulation protein [Streptococcus oricebi]
MKIVIIGYSGSGKSTLAKKLAQHYSIPKLHLDTLQFKANWEVSEREDMENKVGDFLSKNTHWVIDGNYSWCHYEKRMEQADLIIFMNFNRWNSLYRVIKRYLKYRGKVREDMAADCPEKLDWEFIRWFLRDGRKKTARERYAKVCQTYADKITILHNQKELDRFTENLK